MKKIPGWPLVMFTADFKGGPPTVPGAGSLSLNSSARRHAVRAWATQRGRQYELDQVPAGTAALTVVDPLEYFHPENTLSPFNQGGREVLPYRPMRITAVWPFEPGNGNMLNTANGYSPLLHNQLGGWSAASPSTTVQVDPIGPKVVVVPRSAGAGFGAVHFFPTAPGEVYTFSILVEPLGNVVAQLRVVDGAGGVHTSVVTTTPHVSQRLSVTWTSVEPFEKVEVYAVSGALPNQFLLSDNMLEFGDVLSPFTETGPRIFNIYTGYIERYPLVYDNAGQRRLAELTAVDALAILSRTEITQSYSDMVKQDKPVLYYPFNDTIPPGRPAAGDIAPQSYVLASEKGGIQWGGDTFLDGTSALSISQQNPYDPPQAGWFAPETERSHVTEWNTRFGTLALPTSGATVECWVRVLAGTCTVLQVGTVTNGQTYNPNQTYFRYASPNGRVQVWVRDELTPIQVISNATGFLDIDPYGWSGYPDGQWHYLAVSWTSPNRDRLMLTVDGAELELAVTPGFTPIWSINNIHMSVNTVQGEPAAQFAVAHWAFYNRNIGREGRLRHYRRGIGNRDELSGTRVERILSTYWAGARRVAPGRLKMAEDYAYGGRMVLDVIQEIQESERGLVYADRNGTVVFEDRQSRYINPNPLWTLGEDPPGADPVEYPYRDYAGDYDPTYTFSQANLSRPGNNSYPPKVNPAAQARYGQRILSQTVQTATDFDLDQAGIFYTGRYAKPKIRIERLTLDPAANPALWPVILGLEIGQKVTVKRRSSAMSTSNNYYVEQINHQVSGDAGTWLVTVELSPVFVESAWVIGDPVRGVLGQTTRPIY